MEKSGKIMVRGEAGFEIESVGELKVSSGDLSIRSKMMELSGSKMDISIDKNIRIGSESFGYFVLNEDGGTIESANHLEILVKNPVSRMRVETGGMCEFLVGKNLELDIKGKMSVIIEEGMTLGTRSSITMVGKEFIRLEGGDLRLIYGDGLIQGKKLKGDIKDVDLEVMNMRVKQTGFGEYVVDTEGKIGLYNKLDGHSARVIEIKVDGNSHEDSLYLGSRSGGVSIEGQRINMNGIVHMERIKTGDRLRIDGDVDLRSLKIGDNLFLEGRGMTMVNRERFEWRNMDVKIGGMLEVGEIRSSKIDGRGGVDIIGDVRIQGGLELGGPLKLKGGSIGDGREFMNIKLGDEYVSNVGIKIQSGQKVGIDIEGGIALKANGRIEVGGILVENELGGQLDELEAGDISSILEDLRVEKDQNGKLKLLKKGKIDLMDTLVKLVALVTHKYNI
jgi:hypothetical protein